MIQELINAFNNSNGAKFVAFEYTNRFGEVAKRLVQINTIYENALKKDLEIVPAVEYEANDKFDHETFVIAKSEIIKSTNASLGKMSLMSKEEATKFENRSNGQKNAYVQIAKNIKYNIETQEIMFFAKEIRKTIVVEGDYPETNSRAKTLAKRFIQKQMKSTKYRTYKLSNIESVKLNGDTIELS